jgi:hypothetical protein
MLPTPPLPLFRGWRHIKKGIRSKAGRFAYFAAERFYLGFPYAMIYHEDPP